MTKLTKQENVGISSERLKNIGEAFDKMAQFTTKEESKS